MAVKKTNADYKREQYARKKEAAEKLGVVDRVLPLPASISDKLDDLCKRHDYTDWRELVINMIRVCHAGADALAVIPKSGFVPSEKQLRKAGKTPTCSICRDLGELCTECEEGYE